MISSDSWDVVILGSGIAGLAGAAAAHELGLRPVGCGVGRHALLLAEHGLAVEAIDGSAAGLAVVREMAQARGVS